MSSQSQPKNFTPTIPQGEVNRPRTRASTRTRRTPLRYKQFDHPDVPMDIADVSEGRGHLNYLENNPAKVGLDLKNLINTLGGGSPGPSKSINPILRIRLQNMRDELCRKEAVIQDLKARLANSENDVAARDQALQNQHEVKIQDKDEKIQNLELRLDEAIDERMMYRGLWLNQAKTNRILERYVPEEAIAESLSFSQVNYNERSSPFY